MFTFGSNYNVIYTLKSYGSINVTYKTLERVSKSHEKITFVRRNAREEDLSLKNVQS